MTAESSSPLSSWRDNWDERNGREADRPHGRHMPKLDRAAGAAWALPVVDATQWIGHEPPEREFVVDEWLVRGTGALLVGEDGIGKSLLGQQLVTCVAAGRSFLGLAVNQAPALYVTCEDPEDELWRRQRTINHTLGVPIDAAPAVLSSLAGYTGIELGARAETGELELSYVGKAIVARAKQLGAALIVLDNLARLFSGNENARHDVAEFCALLERMALDTNATVLLVAHPSKGGAEYSGSTGWSAHVRQRLYFSRTSDDTGVDDDARILRKSKANYSKSGVEVACRWHQWAFVRPDDLPDDQRVKIADNIKASAENAAFIACLRERLAQGDGREVGPSPGPNYAPSQFEGMTQAKGFRKASLKCAMDRLFALGKIETVTVRNVAKGRNVTVLREVLEASPNASPNASRTLSPNTPDQCSQTTPRTHPIDKSIPGPASWAAGPDPDDIDWGDEGERPE